MPRKDSIEYREYMRDYMRQKRAGLRLTGLTSELRVGAGRFELPASASRTLRANQTALRPAGDIICSL